mmetsp:Transcript_1987/g.7133  ORF Transcript_1987/g.7133 Transcript_1987/m.7133 type:complete len:261 (-) Transcript_1987:694-1476(-)
MFFRRAFLVFLRKMSSKSAQNSQRRSSPSSGTLFKMQAVSGGLFAAFAVTHLLNHSLLLIPGNNTQDHEHLMIQLRSIYQNPVVEFTLIGAFILHSATGLVQLVNRVQRMGLKGIPFLGSGPPSLDWHRISGYVLSGVVVGHFAATRWFPLQSGYQIDVTYATLSMEVLPWIFPLYYTLFTACSIYHSLYGITQAVNRLGPSSVRIPQTQSLWKKILFGSLVAGATITWGVYGHPIPRREEFLQIYESYMPPFLQVWKSM